MRARPHAVAATEFARQSCFKHRQQPNFSWNATLKIHRIATTGTALDFDAALKRASEVAGELLGENMLLSWYDRERDLESPAHAGECHEGCPVRGYWDYALNRGAALAVDFDAGRFVFCFRPLEEFAPPQ